MIETSRPSGATALRGAWQADFLASIVVFLVALPLCMGVAIASGVPTEKAAAVGIITGIVGGLLVGFLAGCSLQVSGPAAGLAVIVGQLIQEHGYQTLGVIIMLAGFFQLLAGRLGCGQWFRAVSPAVIQGMLAGIGILIFTAQFHVMVDDRPPGTGKEFGGILNLVTLPQAVWKGITETQHRPAAMIGVLTIVSIVLWAGFAPKKVKFFPAPLMGVLLATIAAALYQAKLTYIAVPDNLADAMQLPAFSDWHDLFAGPSLIEKVGPVLLAGLALAFVAGAESLLTATAVDAMQQHAPRTNYDRELMAQGAGNVLCGLVGGLPITGVIVRSIANVQAGGRTRASAILHGVWLLLFGAMLPQVLRLVPVASLAAVLVYTGYKLMNPKAVRQLFEFGKGEVAIYAATLGTVVVIDLLTGIVVGIGLALGKLLYTFSHLNVTVQFDPQHGRSVLFLEGTASFVRLPKLAAALETVPRETELHVHFERLDYIDHACLELLLNWETQHEASGGSLVLDWDKLKARFQRNGNDGIEVSKEPPGVAQEGQQPATRRMSVITSPLGYTRMLVATDFSSHADAALKQAVWLAHQGAAKITVAHTLPNLRRSAYSQPGPNTERLMDLVYGKGEQFEEFEREARREAETKLSRMVELNAADLDVQVQVLQGDLSVEITHAVHQAGHDLVLAGTRGVAAWEQFFVGSTAKRLIRKCPASVWIVKAEHVGPPRVVLAATDFSDVSLKAVAQGLLVARLADAEFHLLHVIDSMDVPEDVIAKAPQGDSLRREINEAAKQRLDACVESLPVDRTRIQVHLSWGTPWKEVGRTAQHLAADLIALGTVGRSGIKGLLLGNTAEKVLDTCDCSMLTVKPDGFVSPIETAR